ncbi:NAD(P)H-binding protein [Granulicella sp. S156]|uniref:NAD(P)H-binding protein n=1 Tax=Granulicella sp. S156 TaxID=1747224 RepID=UPI00131EBD6D|nr:NAD(P)H-binding protein [Granulicella sp. S156]
MYLIVGATGNVGSEVVGQLLAAQKQVRVFTRDASKVSHLKGPIEVAVGDLMQADTFARAVAGVEGVFLMNGPLEGEAFRRLIAQAKASGNPRVVFLSTLFAAYPDSLVGELHKDKEDVIRASGLPHSFVRAGNFMTNTFQWLETIKSEGVVYNATGDAKTAPVAPQDIAAVAVQALTKPDTPEGFEVLEVTGGELLTVPEQAGIVSRVTGRPIRVVEINSEQAEQGLLKAGLPSFMAKAVAGCYEEIRNGKVAFVRDAVQNAKGSLPVTYADWVESQRTQLA